MLAEIKAVEPQLKQILYECVEHVQATKAALYLSASNDLSTKTFELVTCYQYNAADRKVLNLRDDLVDRLSVKRGPFFVNGLGADQRFSEMLFRQGNDRLLAAPIIVKGRLVGFIDMRDKAGKRPFDTPDVEAAKKIADQVLAFLAGKNLLGITTITLSERNPTPVPTLPQTIPLSQAPEPPPQPLRPGAILSPRAAQVVETARDRVAKQQFSTSTGKRILPDADLEVVRLLLPAVLAIPGAVLGCFSAIGHPNNPQSIVAIASVMEDTMEMLREHLEAWLRRSNQNVQIPTMRPHIVYPFGVQVVPVTAAGISTMLSAPVNPQSVEGLVLTVGFERTPEAQAQRALHIFLRQIEQSVETAIAASIGRNDRQIVAQKLMEPDFEKYPDLVDHCREVSMLSQRFATLIELPPAQVETVRLAALVHDVGMRLLDYDRLYKRPHLTTEELRALSEHPVVGAALVEPLLGAEVAVAVLRHHERVDGRGYPSRLSGSQIPMASRILQICDAWIAMTSSRTPYQSPMQHSQAIAKMREGAGAQFDEGLLNRFLNSFTELDIY